MTDLATVFTAQTGSFALTRRVLLVLALLLAPPALLFFAGSAFAAPATTEASTLRIVVPTRDINRGEVIGESDLTFAEVSGTALAPSTATKFETLAGMQTRRLLRAGNAVRAEDVRRPVVVTKGQTVTMTFEAPGIALSAMGRAMGEGGVGDTITVQNPVSFRMVTATITGAGTVRAEMASPLTTTARK